MIAIFGCDIFAVNRHTGGLENNVTVIVINALVNRHTGGLENTRIL